jgi:hypothetical protein
MVQPREKYRSSTTRASTRRLTSPRTVSKVTNVLINPTEIHPSPYFVRCARPTTGRLALNIHTSDGHNVNYANYDFWQSASELGGAVSDSELAFISDYKDFSIFAGEVADELLVVVHDGAGSALGWRTWNLVAGDKALQVNKSLARLPP